jgi:hypothetical protein
MLKKALQNKVILLLGMIVILFGLVGPEIFASIDHPMPNRQSGTVEFRNPIEQVVYLVVSGSDCGDISYLQPAISQLRYCERHGRSVCVCAVNLPAGGYSIKLPPEIEIKVLRHLDGDGLRQLMGQILVGVGVFFFMAGLMLGFKRRFWNGIDAN